MKDDRRKPPPLPPRPPQAPPHAAASDAPTIPPPEDPFARFDRGDPRATITNEVELEAARIQSMQVVSSLPPPAPDASRRQPGSGAPSGPSSLLSLANLQAPSLPPPADIRGLPSPPPLAPEALPSIDELPHPAEARAAETPAPVDPRAEMRDRFSLGDYSGALDLASQLLAADPQDVEATACAGNCRAVLLKMYTAKLGPLDRVPVVVVPRNQLRWLSIDHRAGFVLSHIDGTSNLEMILDVSGMPPLDALKILHELAQQRIIAFR